MKIFFAFALFFISVSVLSAQVPYSTVPDWRSSENDYNGTGSAVDDINGDDFPDLAVSNGNDIVEAPNLAYININGILPTVATWMSSNETYSGHCELADFDSDGFPELAVSNFISGNWDPNLLNIYDNIDGTLEETPSWVSSDSIYSFRLAWGDIDSDGDLDLAVATGEPYHSYLEPSFVYYNIDGVMQTTPGWASDDPDACLDVKWVDIELDGDLDLAVCESVGRIKIYMNSGGSLATLPDWTTDEEDNFNSIDFADVNGDGYPELAAAANTQLAGSGRFKLYLNEGGTLQTSPFWQSGNAGYGSEAAFADIDDDGDFDLVCGRWWGMVYIYLNDDGQFQQFPNWNSSGSWQSVIENIVFGDFNRGAERTYRQTFGAYGGRLFQISRRQIAGVDSVLVDGNSIDLSQYCVSNWDAWVSLGVDPVSTVEIVYRYSVSKDMAVSNWDRETFVFHNTSLGFIPGDVNDSGRINGLDVVFLVNYLKGGPLPMPRLAADCDGNCEINGMDVTFLINYLKGGPAPAAGDCD